MLRAEPFRKKTAQHIGFVRSRHRNEQFRFRNARFAQHFAVNAVAADTYDVVNICYPCHGCAVKIHGNNVLPLRNEAGNDRLTYLSAADNYNFHIFLLPSVVKTAHRLSDVRAI